MSGDLPVPAVPETAPGPPASDGAVTVLAAPPVEEGTLSPGPSRLRRWLLAILALQVVLVVAGLLVWRLLPDAPAPPPLPEPDTAAATPATLESGLPLAQRQATAWLPDARLMLATEQVDWPWEVPPGPATLLPGTGWLTYVFVAPWHAPGRPGSAATISLMIERLSGQIVSQNVLPWQQAPAIPPDWIPPATDSTAAILAAEAAGGTEYRRACPENRHLTRASLADFAPWGRHWVVTYQDASRPDQNGLLVRVDAATGVVLQVQMLLPDCI